MPNVPFIRESASTHATNLIAWAVGLAQSTAGRVTDYNRGGIKRTLLEAVALRLEHLDAKVFGALRRAIPTVLYEFFGPGDGVTTFVGFPRIPALAATGIARFQRDPGAVGAIPIPLDTVLAVMSENGTAPEKLYEVIVPATLAAGATFVDTLVRAREVGAGGNTPAATLALKAIPSNPELLSSLSATNPAAILSGQDTETDEQRRVRWRLYIRNLGRAQHDGLTVAALQAQVVVGGVVVERALFARSLPVPEKRGLVEVFVDNGGGGASPALVAVAQQLIDGAFAPDGSPIPGYKAAGAVAIARAVTPQVIDVTCRIRVLPGYSFLAVREAVTTAITACLFDLGVFQDLILSQLERVITSVAGVADAGVELPASNVTTLQGARILAGQVTVTEMAIA